MGRTDTVIAVAGIALLVAAAFTLYYTQENEVGFDTYTFTTRDVALETRMVELGAGTETMEWHDVPDNATQAMVDVTVSFSGQAVQGGTVSGEAVLTAPDGQTHERQRFTFDVEAGATRATGQVVLELGWAQVPQDVKLQPGNMPAVASWDAPLKLEITIQPPGDLPALSQYAFTAEATGHLVVYQA